MATRKRYKSRRINRQPSIDDVIQKFNLYGWNVVDIEETQTYCGIGPSGTTTINFEHPNKEYTSTVYSREQRSKTTVKVHIVINEFKYSLSNASNEFVKTPINTWGSPQTLKSKTCTTREILILAKLKKNLNEVKSGIRYGK